MGKPFDAAFKEMIEAFAEGFVGFLRRRLALPEGPVTVEESDLSTVTAAGDKVLAIGGACVVQVEGQSGPNLTEHRLLLRIGAESTRYRIPDLCVMAGGYARTSVLAEPPVLVVENSRQKSRGSRG